MRLFAPLPDRPEFKEDGTVDDDDALLAWGEGATLDEWRESERTGVVTLSMHIRWWWRRTRRVLR